MKYEIRFAVIILIVTIAMSMATSVRTQPRLAVAEGDVFDWGTRGPGKLTTTLHLKNIGSDTLRIAEVRVSCGCTTAPVSRNILKPNDTASIGIVIKAEEKIGDIRKQIFIVSNDPSDSVKEITLKANLIRDIVAFPVVFSSLLGVEIDSEYETTVILTNVGQDTLSITKPFLDSKTMKARFNILQPTSLLPNASMELTCFVTPLSDGFLLGTIHVPSNSQSVPDMQITFRCQAESVAEKRSDKIRLTSTIKK